ncbi:hypothetical protein E2562_012932 [Oryza meyeriana var. granulata]|uniref:Uncharacterized protein n=1 Tax=Oryza meyeriana var. granulata TaxID=110450 RepID=A0A6G1CEN5_9ORYZ|nr:hypothetical protein E2562_012932 [Oryza meyeriana var. granulata]
MGNGSYSSKEWAPRASDPTQTRIHDRLVALVHGHGRASSSSSSRGGGVDWIPSSPAARQSRIQAARLSIRAGMAGRKRKAEAARVAEEEADRALYGAFRGAANSLSQLYALAGGHQRVSFHAGERHALEKLYQWMVRQHESGLRLTVSDIASHIQVHISLCRLIIHFCTTHLFFAELLS